MTPDTIPGYSGPVAALIPGAVYIAERPGGGGRSHRVARMQADMNAAAAAGVRTIISGMRSRHALIDYAQNGFGVRWHPLKDLVQSRVEIPRLVNEAAAVMAREPGAVLLHVDRWSEWDAAIAAAFMVRAGIAPDIAAALEMAEGYGLPVGDLARAILAP